jgi:hypothetical protein
MKRITSIILISLGLAACGSAQAETPQATAADTFSAWVAEYGSAYSDVLTTSIDVASHADDLTTAMASCQTAFNMLDEAKALPFAIADNTPSEVGTIIDEYRQGYFACSEGDFDKATAYINTATGLVKVLTARIKALTP